MNYHFTGQETQTARKRGPGCLTSLVIRDMQMEHWEPTASCLLQQGEAFGMRDEPVYLSSWCSVSRTRCQRLQTRLLQPSPEP